MLFKALALLPLLPLFLAAPSPYNPFPPSDVDIPPYISHGRSGLSPELLAAYRTSDASGTSKAEAVMISGRHYRRGASMLHERAVGQGRRSKVRVVKRQAVTCRPISSSASVTPAPTSTSMQFISASLSPPVKSRSSSGMATPTDPISSSSASSTSASMAASGGASVVPSASSASSVVVPAVPSSSQPPKAQEPSSTSTSPSSTSSIASSTAAITPSSSSGTSSAASTTSSTPATPPAPSSSASLASSASSSAPPTPSSTPSSTSVARITNDRSGTDGPFSGWGTWYDVGLGACGKWDTPDQPIVAIAAELMDNWPGYDGRNPNNHPMCGKHLKITWRGISTIARVADRCPGCAVRSLDMSKGIFEHFATLDVGLLGMDSYTGNITWSWVAGEGALPSLPYTP